MEESDEKKSRTTFTHFSPKVRKKSPTYSNTQTYAKSSGTRTRYKNSHKPKHSIKQQNTTKAEFVYLHATLPIDHTSEKQTLN